MQKAYLEDLRKAGEAFQESLTRIYDFAEPLEELPPEPAPRERRLQRKRKSAELLRIAFADLGKLLRNGIFEKNRLHILRQHGDAIAVKLLSFVIL